ncbi:TPA: restriction endonuclease subunit S [Escherichia coli]|nr:restriction endonuclease subunit S [Escherichia coli]
MVPNGWEETRLKHIARIKSGSTPLRAKQDLYYSQDGTPWVKTLDLNNAEIFETDERITELALKETSCSIFPVNTVLVAMYGGFNQIGRTGLLTVPSAINQALSGLMLDGTKADSKYILNYLNGNVRQWKKFAASSRKDPNITREDVCNFEVLLPPLPEQRKIAQILSTWDKAITTTERLIATSQQQKKALMQQLLTGKKRLVNPETGKVFEGDWEEVKVSQFGSVVSGGTPSTESPSYWNGNVHWVTPTDITKLSTRTINKTARTITDEGLKNSSAKLVPAGSLLVCTRATIGEIAISQHEMCTNQGFKNVIPNKKTNIEFLYYLMCFEKHKLVSKASGSTFLELSKKDFEHIRFIVPKVNEQQKIASVLTVADKEIELLQAKLAHLKEEKKALMQQLLTGKRRVKIEHMEVA